MLGCSCDNDWSMGISWEEFNTGACTWVQTQIFGSTMTHDMFDAMDTDQDGEINGHEAATAIEAHLATL